MTQELLVAVDPEEDMPIGIVTVPYRIFGYFLSYFIAEKNIDGTYWGERSHLDATSRYIVRPDWKILQVEAFDALPRIGYIADASTIWSIWEREQTGDGSWIALGAQCRYVSGKIIFCDVIIADDAAPGWRHDWFWGLDWC